MGFGVFLTKTAGDEESKPLPHPDIMDKLKKAQVQRQGQDMPRCGRIFRRFITISAG